MQEVIRKDNESFENLFRRFNRRVQQSGVLSKARKKMYFEKDQSRAMLREEAVRKSKIRARRPQRSTR
ncbi:30S ribosomal protein S21 [bacterium]|nr:30S ribosomal protein S21 [bacterium]